MDTPNDNLTMRSPMLVTGLGTFANFQVRHFYKRLIESAGGEVDFIKIFSIDGTSQIAKPDLPVLSDQSFFNAAEDPQILVRMRRAMRDPRVSQYLTPKAALLAVGDGAGAIPGVARYLLEQTHTKCIARISSLVREFQKSDRARVAERAREAEWLQQHGVAITSDGAIDVYVVLAINGGMGAGWLYSTLLLRHVLKSLGIPAKWKLILTPTASDCGNSPDDIIKKSLAYARFSELLDFHEGRTIRWPVSDSFTIEDAGPFFESIFVMPEPIKTSLDDQRRFVGDYLFDMVGPLGKAINDKAVDKLRSAHQRGPRGTLALLNLVSGATLQAAAFDDVGEFAFVELGAQSLGTGNTGNNDELALRVADDIVANINLRRADIEKQRPVIAVPDIPAGMPANKIEALLQSVGRRAYGQAAKLASENLTSLCQLVDAAPQVLRDKLVQNIRTNGVNFAARVSQSIAQQMNGLLAFIRSESARLAAVQISSASSISQQVQNVVDAATRKAYAELLLRKFVPSLETFVVQVDSLDKIVQQLARCRDATAARFQDLRRRYSSPARYAVLDQTALQKRIEDLAEPTSVDVCNCFVEALVKKQRMDGLEDAIDLAIRSRAESFRRLESLDEAFEFDAAAGHWAFTNAIAGAEPNHRIDAECDSSNVSHHLFVTMSEDDPKAILALKADREVTFVRRCKPSEIKIVRIDFNHEICSMTAAAEAHDAYTRADDDFPPFADKNFEPRCDIMVPAPSDWLANIVLAIHLVLGTGVIRFEKARSRYYYGDILLGENRAEASGRLLQEQGRLPALPTRDELVADAEKRLFEGRGREQVIMLLRSIEDRLNQHLSTRPSHILRQVLYRERAAVCGLIDQLITRSADDEKEANSWSNGELEVRPEPIIRRSTIVSAVSAGHEQNGQQSSNSNHRTT